MFPNPLDEVNQRVKADQSRQNLVARLVENQLRCGWRLFARHFSGQLRIGGNVDRHERGSSPLLDHARQDFPLHLDAGGTTGAGQKDHHRLAFGVLDRGRLVVGGQGFRRLRIGRLRLFGRGRLYDLNRLRIVVAAAIEKSASIGRGRAQQNQGHKENKAFHRTPPKKSSSGAPHSSSM
jgi:hypothetical protein